MRRFAPIARTLLVVFLALSGLAVPAAAWGADRRVPNIDGPFSLKSIVDCRANGVYRVFWELANFGWAPAEVTSVALTGITMEGDLEVGATIEPQRLLSLFVQLPGDPISATLTVGVISGENTYTVGQSISVGTCEPYYTLTQTCDGMTFTFKAPPTTPDPTGLGRTRWGGPYDVWVRDAQDMTMFFAKFTMSPNDPDRTVTLAAKPGFEAFIFILEPGANENGLRLFEDEEWLPPSNCGAPSPEPPASDPAPQSLPATGTGVATPLGIGLGLTIGGALLITAPYVFRRRRSVSGA